MTTLPTQDLDQSGSAWQIARVNLGPTLGWVHVQVRPTQTITVAGTTTLLPGSSVAFVNVAGLVTINLPDVSAWVKEAAYRPATAFERSIWIKDLGGNAVNFNITVVPFGLQTIDLLNQSFTIIQNRQLLRLYPMSDFTGWYSG